MAHSDNFRPIRQIDAKAPRFVEAYPRFNALNAEKAIRGGATICEFTQGRRLVGRWVFRKYLDEPSQPRWILGDHEILGSPYIPSVADDDASFQTVAASADVGFTRFYVKCPACRKARAVLAFTRWWA